MGDKAEGASKAFSGRVAGLAGFLAEEALSVSADGIAGEA